MYVHFTGTEASWSTKKNCFTQKRDNVYTTARKSASASEQQNYTSRGTYKICMAFIQFCTYVG